MGAVWMRLRAESRARWRAWLAVAVLAGIFGGAVVAAAAGAIRTDSVVDRNLAATRQPDIFFAPEFTVAADDPQLLAKLSFDRIMAFDSVADGALFREIGTDEGLVFHASEDPRVGHSIIREIALEGRPPDPTRPDEAAINFLAARRLGLSPGDTFTFRFPGMPREDAAEAPPGPTVTFRITGVTAGVSDHGKYAEPSFFLTSAFLERYGAAIPSAELMTFILKDGPRSYAQFDREMNALTGGGQLFYVEAQKGADQTRRSFGLQAAALWILAAFLAIVTALVLGQTVARQTYLESTDDPVLRALGWSKGQLLALGMIRWAAIGVAGALIAVAVAVAASPLTSFGLARLIEPSKGFSAPAMTMLTGLVGILAAVLVLAAYPTARAARLGSLGVGSAEQGESRRPSRIAHAVSRLAAGPSAGIGTRMALEPGRGRTAVPVWTTIGGTCIAIVGLVAALVVGSSLEHMRTTPRVYGWNWDVIVQGSFEDPAARRALADTDGVREVAFGSIGGGLLIDDVQVDGIGVQAGARILPPILEGRAPDGPGEIALARKTMRATGKRIGDVVSLRFQGSTTGLELRVVGVTVLPFEGDVSALGDGFFIRMEAIRPIYGGPLDAAFVRFKASAPSTLFVKNLRERYGPDSVSFAEAPLTVVDFGRVSNMPYLLAGIVAALAAGTLAHGLVTAVRRRRRDLAVLKTIGFDRGQVRRAVAWQATATAVVTLALGIPLGVILGRWVWRLFAHQTGFLAEPVVSLATLSVAVPATIVAANILAALPGRSAARTHPALVLRTE